jgi:hypothetical protein
VTRGIQRRRCLFSRRHLPVAYLHVCRALQYGWPATLAELDAEREIAQER